MSTLRPALGRIEQKLIIVLWIHRLRKELKGMRKQLAERSREADNNQSTFNVESKPEKQTNSSEYTNEVEANGCVVM